MKRHGASHGLAYIVSTIAAAMLTGIVRDHYPNLLSYFDNVCQLIIDKFNLNIKVETFSLMSLAVVLAVVWGIAFAFMHRDKM